MKLIVIIALLLAVVYGVNAQVAAPQAVVSTATVVPTVTPSTVVPTSVTTTTTATTAADTTAADTPFPPVCAIVEKASTVISKLKDKVMLPTPGQKCGNGGTCTSRREWCHGTVVLNQCTAFCCVPTAASHTNAPTPAVQPLPSPTNTVAADSTSVASQVVATGKIPLGPSWVSQFPGTNSLDDLNNVFGPKAKAFIGAIRTAGGSVSIAATHRPMERSYLMYNAWRLAKGAVTSTAITPLSGVNIDWTAGGNAAKARALAQQMCAAYGIQWSSARQRVAPQGASRHNFRAAVDMNITGYVGKSIAGPDGKLVKVTGFSGLVALGAKYGVHYFSGENMHWSDTGH